MRPAPQRLIEKVAFLGLGLALGYLAAAQPTWAGPRQPGSAPHEHGRPDHAAAPPTRASLRQPSTMPIAWMPPPGVVQISPCVPHMGEHWARPADWPLGPIYTVHDGRLVSIEYMVTQADLAAGKSWNDLTFRYWGQQLPIEHADVDFLPHGHEGFEVPHYDMHFHVVGHAEDREITCQP